MFADKLTANHCVVPLLIKRQLLIALLLILIGQKECWQTKAPHQQNNKHPTMSASPKDKTLIAGCESRYSATMTTRRCCHTILQWEHFQHSRHKEQCHNHRHHQIYYYHQRKVHQAQPLSLGQEPYHRQCTDGRKQRAENRKERLSVAVVAVMIDHNNRCVDDNSQRHSYSCQGIDMNIEREEMIKYHRHQDIDNQRRHNHQ